MTDHIGEELAEERQRTKMQKNILMSLRLVRAPHQCHAAPTPRRAAPRIVADKAPAPSPSRAAWHAQVEKVAADSAEMKQQLAEVSTQCDVLHSQMMMAATAASTAPRNTGNMPPVADSMLGA